MKPGVEAARQPLFHRDLLERLLLAAYAGLITISVLVPSDVPAGLSQFVVTGMLWMLLAVAAVAFWVVGVGVPQDGGPNCLRFDAIDWLALGYLAWQLISTLATSGVGDMRSAINAFFQSASFVVALMVGRRLLSSPERRRDFLAVALSVVVAIALLGICQYLVLNPDRHRQWREHPEELLQPLGIEDSESPEARRALDRALSPEPLGTFALTNSLAVLLVPGIVLLVAAGWLGFRNAHKPIQKHRFAGTLLILLMLAALLACLAFTKSRASFLALLLGLGLLTIVQSRFGQRWSHWGIGIAVGGVALLIVTVLAASTLDRSIVSGAPASVLYRLQYWQSTAAMIADHPLVGCGPGNFKNVYTRYKLPEASEEIGDPHNFIFELASTAGIPAFVLFALLLGGTITARAAVQTSTETLRHDLWAPSGATVAVVAITLFPQSADGNWVLMFFIPAAVAMWLWVRSVLGRLIAADQFALGTAALTLLVNLLAAGGVGFPNISLPLAMLLALCAPSRRVAIEDTRTPIYQGSVVMLGSIGLCIGCLFTCYRPVLEARRHVSRGMEQALENRSPLEAYSAAAAADPWDPQLSLDLASIALGEFLQTGNEQSWGVAQLAYREAIVRNPRSYAIYKASAQAHLTAFRVLGDQSLIQQAMEYFTKALDWYPNFSVLHADLAWAAHVAGDAELARSEAREALRLDELCPHEDKKLVGYHLTDIGMPAQFAALPLHQLMHRLAE